MCAQEVINMGGGGGGGREFWETNGGWGVKSLVSVRGVVRK